MVAHKRSSFGMQAAFGELITFCNNNQVLIKNCCYGNSRFTTWPQSWPQSWSFQKFYFTQNYSTFTESLVQNICLQPQIGISLRIESKGRNLNKFSQKCTVFYSPVYTAQTNPGCVYTTLFQTNPGRTRVSSVYTTN